MKTLFVVIIVGSLIGLSFIAKPKRKSKPEGLRPAAGLYEPVAVLELFTSEGCSSCPPADNLLPQLAALDPHVIALSFHVDYWDRLGWKDPFSRSEYSERQREYGRQLKLESIYTPELVVNGTYELVGSSRSKAESTIRTALKEKAAVALTIENIKTEKDKLSFTVKADGDLKKTKLLVALVQKQAVTHVKAGENNGATLTHTNTVRAFIMQTAVSANVVELSIPPDLHGNQCQLVVYTQRSDNLRITGAVMKNYE